MSGDNARVHKILAWNSCSKWMAGKAPPGYFDLGQMLKDLIANGVSVKVCGTCKARCGRFRNEPYFDGAREATMNELAEWVRQADRILTF